MEAILVYRTNSSTVRAAEKPKTKKKLLNKCVCVYIHTHTHTYIYIFMLYLFMTMETLSFFKLRFVFKVVVETTRLFGSVLEFFCLHLLEKSVR